MRLPGAQCGRGRARGEGGQVRTELGKAKQLIDQAEAYQISKKGSEKSRSPASRVEPSGSGRLTRHRDEALRRGRDRGREEGGRRAQAQVMAEAQARKWRPGARSAGRQGGEAEAARRAALSGEEKAKAQAAEASQQAAQAPVRRLPPMRQKAALAQEQDAKAQAAAATQSASELRANLLAQFNSFCLPRTHRAASSSTWG
jgi:hypothetical protein